MDDKKQFNKCKICNVFQVSLSACQREITAGKGYATLVSEIIISKGNICSARLQFFPIGADSISREMNTFSPEFFPFGHTH